MEEKDAIWIIFYENVHPTLTSDHRKDFIKTLKLAIWPPNAWCMLYVEVLKKKKKKKILTGDQSIFIMGGGGRGMEEDLRGGSKNFQEEQKEDQTSPTEYKVGDYWKLTAGEPPLRGDFIVTQTKSSSSQGINITGPLRKMSLIRARLRDNFNFKESGKTD